MRSFTSRISSWSSCPAIVRPHSQVISRAICPPNGAPSPAPSPWASQHDPYCRWHGRCASGIRDGSGGGRGVRRRAGPRAAPVPWVTPALIALNVLVFVYELALPSRALEPFIRAWGVVPAERQLVLVLAALAALLFRLF
jgi:hypothetical protein